MAKMVLTTDGNLYARFFIEVGQAVTPVDDTLYDSSGATYTCGSYDTFQGYGENTTPTNRGYGWETSWTVSGRYTRVIVAEDLLTDYTAGSNLSGSSGGSGWSAAWNVIEGR